MRWWSFLPSQLCVCPQKERKRKSQEKYKKKTGATRLASSSPSSLSSRLPKKHQEKDKEKEKMLKRRRRIFFLKKKRKNKRKTKKKKKKKKKEQKRKKQVPPGWLLLASKSKEKKGTPRWGSSWVEDLLEELERALPPPQVRVFPSNHLWCSSCSNSLSSIVHVSTIPTLNRVIFQVGSMTFTKGGASWGLKVKGGGFKVEGERIGVGQGGRSHFGSSHFLFNGSLLAREPSACLVVCEFFFSTTVNPTQGVDQDRRGVRPKSEKWPRVERNQSAVPAQGQWDLQNKEGGVNHFLQEARQRVSQLEPFSFRRCEEPGGHHVAGVGPVCSSGTSSGCSACTLRTICCPGSEVVGCSRQGTSQICFQVGRGR